MGVWPFSRRVTAWLLVLSIVLGTLSTYAVAHVAMRHAQQNPFVFLKLKRAVEPPDSIKAAFGPEFPRFDPSTIEEYKDACITAYTGSALSYGDTEPGLRYVHVVLAGWPMRAIRVDETRDIPQAWNYLAIVLPTDAIDKGTRTIHPLGYTINSALNSLAWFTVLSILVLGLQFATGHIRRTKIVAARKAGKCPSCGYEKQSLVTCPECGQSDAPKE